MEPHEQITAAFEALPCVTDWPELLDLFRRVAARKPNHWLLPVKACLAVGGTLEQAVPAALAIGCCHLGIVLVDDMLDDDPRGEYRQMGQAAAANMSSALQAAALAAVAHSPAAPQHKLAALDALSGMLLSTTLGQYWDIQSPADETGYWRVVRAKSSPFFGATLQLGALLAGADLGTAGQLQALGALYGEMVQIHDDLNDSMAVPANPDWLLRRYSLPILFARQVEHPDKARFVELCERAGDDDALMEAQQILIRCGAVSYCVDRLLDRHAAMQTVLTGTRLACPEEIQALVDALIAPARTLLAGVAS